MTVVAFCIGNGESRRGYDVNSLAKHGKIYAANAFHRDYTPDYLVCCDRRMVDEVIELNRYNGLIYTRGKWAAAYRNDRIKSLPDFSWNEDVKWKKTFHWGSGLHGVHLACVNNCSDIFIIGHDLYGIEGKHNNVYKGTNNYLPKDFNEVDPSFWIKQFNLLFETFRSINFYICQPNAKSWPIPELWPQQVILNNKINHQIQTNVFIQELGKITQTLEKLQESTHAHSIQ